MGKFTSICTYFTYQDIPEYAMIYQDRVSMVKPWNPSKIKEKRGYTRICKEKSKCSLFATATSVVPRWQNSFLNI